MMTPEAVTYEIVGLRVQPVTPPAIDIPDGEDSIDCDCTCHIGLLLEHVFYELETRIGIIKCAECACYDRRTLFSE